VIALVDYGAGNLTSVRKGFAAVGAELFVPSDPSDLTRAAGIVIPGVGHFGATQALAGPWTCEIRSAAANGIPLLGICLGLQWLFEGSDEAPDVPGLGLIPDRCFRLPAGQKVPHVGWNSLSLTRKSRLFEGIEDRTQVYFTHSYAAPVTGECVAITTHSISFAAAIEMDAVSGVQFHPEKSSAAGIQVLRNFVSRVGGR
jgi:imidazole glycerol-phosphate synthase subunit HisH